MYHLYRERNTSVSWKLSYPESFSHPESCHCEVCTIKTGNIYFEIFFQKMTFWLQLNFLTSSYWTNAITWISSSLSKFQQKKIKCCSVPSYRERHTLVSRKLSYPESPGKFFSIGKFKKKLKIAAKGCQFQNNYLKNENFLAKFWHNLTNEKGLTNFADTLKTQKNIWKTCQKLWWNWNGQ